MTDAGESRSPEADRPIFTLPGHEVLRELARGGMGIVYQARQLEPPRDVAVKMLLPFQATSVGMRERFRIEARAIASLDHPGILPIYQVGEHDGTPYFTLKLATGGSLAARIPQFQGRWRTIAELMVTVAEAVQFAHDHGVLHRDLKPGNILFDESGRPFVSDFGLAKELSSDSDLTRSTDLLGTPHYVAPEVAARSARAATTASDVYSLGAILYELLAGRPPFEAEGVPALLKKIAEEDPKRIRGYHPRTGGHALGDSVPARTLDQNQVPRDLEIICLKCLAKEPERRYVSARELAEDLHRWLSGNPILARPATAIEQTMLWARRNRGLAAALITITAMIVILVVGSIGAAVRIAASRAEALRTVEVLESQRAGSLFAAGGTADAIALLARRVREDPMNWRDAQRLMWALQLRKWAVPMRKPVKLLSESAPEQALVTMTQDHLGRLLALVSGTNLLVHDVAAGTNRHVWPLTFSPSGICAPKGAKLVALGVGSNGVLFLDMERGNPLPFTIKVAPHNRELPVTFNRAQSLAFIVSPDYSGQLLDLRSGALRILSAGNTDETVSILTHHPCATFSPDGRHLAFSDRDRTVRLLNLESGEITGRPFVAADRVHGLSFTDDGRLLMAQGAGPIQIWSLETGDETPPVAETTLAFKPSLFRPNSHQLLLAGNADGLVKYDLTSRQLMRQTGRSRLTEGRLFVEEDGSKASVAYERSHVVYDLETCRPLCEPVEHGAALKRPARFLNPGFATLGDDTSLVLWQAATNHLLPLVLTHGSPVHSARFSPDGRRVITTATDGRAILWDASTGLPSAVTIKHASRIWSACFSPDGRRVATGSWDASARLWSTETGEPLCEPLRAANYVFHVEFSPNGRQLLACGEDGRVRVYDGEKGDFRYELTHTRPVYWAHFSPDGSMIVTRPMWERPRLWHAEGGGLIRELEETTPSEGSAAVFIRGDFSRDSRWLALGSQARCATVWRMPGGERHRTLPHAGVVRNAVFSPDARFLLATSDDLTSQLWEVQTGLPQSGTLASPQSLEMESNSGNTLRTAAYHPDGKRAVAGGSDMVLSFWDSSRGYSLGEGLAFEGTIMHAEFSPDGRRILAASLDGTAQIWPLPPVLDRAPAWLAPLAEALVGRRLSGHGISEAVAPPALWDACESLRGAETHDPATVWARQIFGF